MITYRITSKTIPPGFSDPEKSLKVQIFRRVLKKALKRFKVDDAVKFGDRKGVVLEICHNIEEIAWDNNRPYVILAVLDKGEKYLFHPSQLTVIKS